MSTKVLSIGALALILSTGCGGKEPAAAKPIPPTPTVDDFEGATSEAPLKHAPSTDER